MQELIERQAALRLCKDADWKDDEDFIVGYSYAMREMAESIEELPTIEAEPAQNWIPVSERLPETKGRYLCSLYYAVPPYHLLHPENDTYIRDVSVQYFDGKSFISSVIAWMPMPNAYEPPNNMIGD